MPPVEFHFFAKSEQGKDVKEILTEDKFVRRFGLEVQDLYGTSPDQAYRDLLSRYAGSVGKPIAGEKSPRNEFYYEAIRRCLGDLDVRFIQLVRNPFDVMASFKHAPFRRQKHIDCPEAELIKICEDWNRSVSLGAARAFFQPREYCLVKFEVLTTDPVKVSAELCSFLGVDFEKERMLNLSDFSEHRDNTSFSGSDVVDSGSNDGRVRSLHSRKGHLTAEEVKTVGSMCGELARAIGYRDEDFSDGPVKLADSRNGVRKNIGRIAGLLKRDRS